VERLKFTDKSIALDTNGNAGTTAKILGAVFGKESVNNKNYVGIGLHFLDSGWTYDNLAGLALDAAGAKTNDQIVSLLWTNVIGSKPSAADKAPYIALLENGMSAGALAHLAADSNFNTTNINLVGLVQTGISFIPIS
jgi:serralysin